MPAIEATCKQRCFCSTRRRRYWPGDIDDIDPLEPVAQYFTFPPGTEVYIKKRTGRGGEPKSTTMIVPGAIEKTVEKPAWDPMDEAVQQRYGEKKIGIIGAACKERGIDIDGKTTPEAHALLIDYEV